MEQQIIIGFDVSSTTIGYSVFLITTYKRIMFIKAGHIKPPKEGTIFERLAKTQAEINSILELYKPTHVAIEDIIQFMPKRSTANTIILLANFNRAVGLVAYNYLNKSPELFSVSDMRSIFKTASKRKNPDKEELPDLLDKMLKIKTNRFYNKNNKLKAETFDEADAILVGLYMCKKILKQI